jgi:AcrR family transcriptional regulator
MSIRKRLSQQESRTVALVAARELLIEFGPQAVTLKAVASRVGRTHANVLHHFGSASGLQKALASFLAGTICQTIAQAVIDSQSGLGSEREVVDLTFDAFDKEGGGALASWMLLTGNEDALGPIVEAIHDMVEELHKYSSGRLREVTLKLVLLALGDALMGGPLSDALDLPRSAARDSAERMLLNAAGQNGPVQAG